VEWGGLRESVEHAATSLDQVSAAAPSDAGRVQAAQSALALRALFQAVEDERLTALGAGASPEQLDQARAAITLRANELSQQLSTLEATGRGSGPNGEPAPASGDL
jgi:hypothetical protein